jgi:hypothetical protein
VLGAPDLLLSFVDVGDALAEVEAAKPKSASNIPLQSDPHQLETTYLAALASSTPSILMRLVAEWVV